MRWLDGAESAVPRNRAISRAHNGSSGSGRRRRRRSFPHRTRSTEATSAGAESARSDRTPIRFRRARSARRSSSSGSGSTTRSHCVAGVRYSGRTISRARSRPSLSERSVILQVVIHRGAEEIADDLFKTRLRDLLFEAGMLDVHVSDLV